MKYFVTGGDGFIGSHLVRSLVERGDVTVLSQVGRTLEKIPDDTARKIQVVRGDILDNDALSSLKGCDTIYHLAAISFVPYSVDNPVKTFEINLGGTQNMLEAARKNDSKFIYISSGQIYGEPTYLPVDEKHPINPSSPYGASKAAADILVNTYNRTYGLETVVLRPFNIYGPGQDRNFVVPSIICQYLENGKAVLGSGSPVRDFTYVDDFIDLLLLSGERREAWGKSFNVGSGQGTSIKDLAITIQNLLEMDKTPVFDTKRARESDIQTLLVDNGKAGEVLGWRPRYSLEEGLREAIEHYRSQKR